MFAIFPRLQRGHDEIVVVNGHLSAFFSRALFARNFAKSDDVANCFFLLRKQCLIPREREAMCTTQ